MKKSDVTIILPVYNLGTLRFNNFCFLIKKLAKIGCSVIVVEQKSQSTGVVEQIVLNMQGVNHLLVDIESSKFNKSKLLNYAAKNSFTPFMWFVDGDFYTDFEKVIPELNQSADFIVPFKEVTFLTQGETVELHASGQLRLTHSEAYKTNNQPGKFSFVVRASVFASSGGFNEGFVGWGFQDLDFVENRLSASVKQDRVDISAYHMYHAPASKEFANVNRQMYINYKEFNQKDIVSKKVKEYQGLAHANMEIRKKFYRDAKLATQKKKIAIKKIAPDAKILARWQAPIYGILYAKAKQIYYPSMDVITIRESQAAKLKNINGKKSKLSINKHFIYYYFEYICHIYELLGSSDILLFANDSFCKEPTSYTQLKKLIEQVKRGRITGNADLGFLYLHKEWPSPTGKYTPQSCFLINSKLILKRPYEYYYTLFTEISGMTTDECDDFRKKLKKIFLD